MVDVDGEKAPVMGMLARMERNMIIEVLFIRDDGTLNSSR